MFDDSVFVLSIVHDQGPFTTFKLLQDRDCDWTSLKFSADGRKILITTNGPVIRLIDAFTGQAQQTFMVSIFVLISVWDFLLGTTISMA